ncbi:hypothetical protein CBS101457_002245 [Exobasidium rhododendri]|nr:hypothetical protein CBS101457_002245 [Exobasidium rhododendri]
MQYLALLSLVAAILLVSPTAAKEQCSPKVVALATGIHLNIVGQHGELASVEKLQAIEKKPKEKGYASKFDVAKGELLSDIAGGINIRKFNQAILPEGNAATAGLKKYASAQLTEQKLSESLTGVPSHDKDILSTLVGDIKNGTELNEQNLAEATKGCSLGFSFPS